MFIAGRYVGRIACSPFCGVWLLRVWLGLALYVGSLFRLMPFSYLFRGGVSLFFIFRVAIWLDVLFVVCWGIALFGNKFLIIQKKKKQCLPSRGYHKSRFYQAKHGHNYEKASIPSFQNTSKIKIMGFYKRTHFFLLKEAPYVP